MAGSFGGGHDGSNPRSEDRDGVRFHPLFNEELNQFIHGANPKYADFHCGHCGSTTNGRVVCTFSRKEDKRLISWCQCSCERGEPTVLVESGEKGGATQFPVAREFHAKENWPADLQRLYDEAAKSYAAGAFTASAMVCRKIVMVCACDKEALERKSFAEYVSFLTDTVLTFPDVKPYIDKIREIGNDANHKVEFVSLDLARTALEIVTYLLNTIYFKRADQPSTESNCPPTA